MLRKKLIIIAASGVLASGAAIGGCSGSAEPAQETLVSDTKNEETAKASDENLQETSSKKTEARKDETYEESFYMTDITEDIFARIEGKSFKEDAWFLRDDLRYLHVLHKDSEGEVHEGEMIVNKLIADDVLDILKQLYENDYPIERMKLVDEYGADDELSMEDNNSSSFNFRYITHSDTVSKHGLGLAVDINPLYNPYVNELDSEIIIEPATAKPYVDRDKDFDYKIEKGDLCYRLFISHGFEWGGDWANEKDYQHFEIPDDFVNEWYPDE